MIMVLGITVVVFTIVVQRNLIVIMTETCEVKWFKIKEQSLYESPCSIT